MIEHTIRIEAPAERVWALTVDIERWPDFVATMHRVEMLDDAPIHVGTTARVTQPRQRPRTWTVTALEAPERFVWETRFGPATMTASHRVAADGPGCTNTLTIDATGRGSRALLFILGPFLRRALATENGGFKSAAESAAGSMTEADLRPGAAPAE